MKNAVLRRFLTVICSAVATLVLAFSVTYAIPGVKAAPLTEGIAGTDGAPVAAVSILDLDECTALGTANFTPNVFLKPGLEIEGTPVTLGKAPQTASRGTYVIVLLNLDPASSAFSADAASLEDRLLSDNSWHFTLHLPAVWSACNVYVNGFLAARIGAIRDYDFIAYSDYAGYTKEHQTATEGIYLDLSFYSRREAIPTDRLQAATVVTIHYESTTSYTGLDEAPVIGSDSAVRRTLARDSSLTASFAAVAAVTVCLCLFFCFVKRSPEFIPEALVALAVFGIMIFNFALVGHAALPSLCRGASTAMFSFVLFAALMPLDHKIGRIPVNAPFLALETASFLLGIVSPYVPVGAAAAIRIARLVFTVVDAAAILAAALLCALREDRKPRKLVVPPAIAVAAVCSVFLPDPVLVAEAAAFWLLAAVTLADFFVNMGNFIETERRNAYLTQNLEREVVRQTEDLHAVLEERDTLLRFVSHDLKKPVRSMQNFLGTLREREKDGELVKMIDIVARKNAEIGEAFDDLGKYAKNNYVAENSAVFDAREAIGTVYERLFPDCEANGIRLVRTDEAAVPVYAKQKCLINVLENLVMNAIEHADCSEIVLGAARRRDKCLITVEDNGQGIRADGDPFAAYVTEGVNGENLGLGLYICRSMVGSMSGTLDYAYRDGRLIFTIALPLS